MLKIFTLVTEGRGHFVVKTRIREFTFPVGFKIQDVKDLLRKKMEGPLCFFEDTDSPVKVWLNDLVAPGMDITFPSKKIVAESCETKVRITVDLEPPILTYKERPVEIYPVLKHDNIGRLHRLTLEELYFDGFTQHTQLNQSVLVSRNGTKTKLSHDIRIDSPQLSADIDHDKILHLCLIYLPDSNNSIVDPRNWLNWFVSIIFN